MSTGDQKGDRLPVIVRINGPNFQIAARGSVAQIEAELEHILGMATRISQELGTTYASPQPGRRALAENVPTIKPSQSTMGNVQLLFSTDWGTSPRALPDVMKALELNAVPDSAGAVSTYLKRLVGKGELRRIEKDGAYAYYRVPSVQ